MNAHCRSRFRRLSAAGIAATLAGVAGGFTSGSSASSMSFVLTEGRVQPGVGYAVRVDVIGAALTSGSSGPALPITLRVHTGDTAADPFGDADSTAGDINQHALAVTKHVIPEMQDADTYVTITATSWDGGTALHQYNSHEQATFVKVLRNGDLTPDIAGANGQEDVEYFLRPYLTPDGSRVWLHENQVLYLFELGTDDVNSSAADFQDAVVLVTLGETLEELDADLPPMNNYAVPMRSPRLAD
ncbi:MAG: hypothetical protein AAF937_07590 [Planctomycetota bacterium]